MPAKKKLESEANIERKKNKNLISVCCGSEKFRAYDCCDNGAKEIFERKCSEKKLCFIERKKREGNKTANDDDGGDAMMMKKRETENFHKRNLRLC
jgi:hypothetical protein